MEEKAFHQRLARRVLLRQSRANRGRVAALVESAAVTAVSTMFYLLLLELAVRVAIGAPILELNDFRTSHAAKVALNPFVDYDQLLGWHIKPFLEIKELNLHTLEYGFRSNGNPIAIVKNGGCLLSDRRLRRDLTFRTTKPGLHTSPR